MKKILWFSLSLGVSVFIFAAVSAVCIILSLSPKTDAKIGQQPSQNTVEPVILEVLMVYADEPTDRYFAAVLSLDMQNATASTESIDCGKVSSSGKTLSEIYKTEGLYPFVDACKTAANNKSLRFIKINSNTFVTIADRMEKIVYNDKNEGQILLTGRQAAENLNDENFAVFCSLMAAHVFDSDINKEFLFVTKVCENDLSYPLLHRKLAGNQ